MAFLSKRVKMGKSEMKVNFSESNLHENNIRVLLFKESGFKGRTLIFDSSLIECLSERMSDVSVTSSLNFQKLPEMVFGSVSLRCHETYFRIHSLSPNRIMFTQVFPFPGSKRTECYALDPHLSHTVKNLFHLGIAPDETSSRNGSMSFELGTQLEQQLFQNQFNARNTSTSTIDSGYGEQSFNSFVISNRSSFNSGISLNRSQNKLRRIETNSLLSESDLYCNYPQYPPKSAPTLGLVIVLTNPTDNDSSECCMKYIFFIESMIFRIRQNIELAVNKPAILLSAMVEVFQESSQWLMGAFPELAICCSCEVTSTELNRYSEEVHDDSLQLKFAPLMFKISHPKFSLLSNMIFPKKDIPRRETVASLSTKSKNGFDKFCELLETLENKETHFFLSTIITATLTYHLGWITTCFPRPTDKDQRKTNSFNSLWRQISELFGACGCPIKSAQTIINGSNQNDIISRVLHFIQYFIRFPTVVQNTIERVDVNADNETVDTICLNYKSSGSFPGKCSSLTHQKKSGLHKTKGWTCNLSELSKEEEYEENLSSPERKVTFVLGENEELTNLKSNCLNLKQINSEGIKNTLETTLDSSKELTSYVEHSSFHSLLHDLSTQQKHLETIDIFNDDHSSASNVEVLDLDVEHQFRKSNPEYFKGKNMQVHSANRKEIMFDKITRMKIITFPLPRSKLNNIFKTSHAFTLKRDTVGKYVPDMVVQGTNLPQKEWILKLRRDLYLTRQIYFFDGYVDESVAVVGNVDNWEVEVVSSRVSINRKSMGMKLDISSLVANMLEVLLEMWNLHFCQKYIATHIEQRLLEICIRSYAFGQLLLHTDMCTMDLLTATLHFEISDIPLLMSVASVIAPQVTEKYGLSFQ